MEAVPRDDRAAAGAKTRHRRHRAEIGSRVAPAMRIVGPAGEDIGGPTREEGRATEVDARKTPRSTTTLTHVEKQTPVRADRCVATGAGVLVLTVIVGAGWSVVRVGIWSRSPMARLQLESNGADTSKAIAEYLQAVRLRLPTSSTPTMPRLRLKPKNDTPRRSPISPGHAGSIPKRMRV